MNQQKNDNHKSSFKIFTIGVYGFEEDQFFEALKNSNIDTFCDIRQRRGVRGAKYSFVNSTKLQSKLAELGIKYLHLKQLAPTSEVRLYQKISDMQNNIMKRDRNFLSYEFVEKYCDTCLKVLTPEFLISILSKERKNVVFFCVEEHPEACHRSIVANWLAPFYGKPTHLVP